MSTSDLTPSQRRYAVDFARARRLGLQEPSQDPSWSSGSSYFDQEQLKWAYNVGTGDWFEYTPQRKYAQTETAVLVMRHLRRLARSQGYSRPTEVTRVSVNYRTGELVTRIRKVNRRHQYLKNQTHGYLAVNDGAATARDISRLLGGNPPPRRRDVGLVA